MRTSASGLISTSSSITSTWLKLRFGRMFMTSIMPRVKPPAPPTFLLGKTCTLSLMSFFASSVWPLSEMNTSRCPQTGLSGFSMSSRLSSATLRSTKLSRRKVHMSMAMFTGFSFSSSTSVSYQPP